MDEKVISLKNVQRRAVRAALKRGHAVGPFTETTALTARGQKVAAAAAHCTECNGEIWALVNGETSVPRLCRSV